MLKNKRVLAVDLDDTVFHTTEYLMHKGYDLSTEEKVIDAFIEEYNNLLNIKPNQLILDFIEKIKPFFELHIVVTARISIPADVTCKQVDRYLGEDFHVFFRSDKGEFLRKLEPRVAFVLDDKPELWGGVENALVISPFDVELSINKLGIQETVSKHLEKLNMVPWGM